MSMLSRFATFATFGGGGDPYWNNVSLLMTGNTLADSSKNNYTFTNTGPVTIASSPVKFGTGSILFNATAGDSKFLQKTSSTIMTMGTGDFTIEGWLYPTTIGARNNTVFDNSSASGPTLHIDSTGHLNFVGNSTDYIHGSTAMSTGNWYYFTIVRISGTVKLYLNGSLDGTVTITDSFAGSYTLTIGNQPGTSRWFQGNLVDFRVTVGVGRYTASFTPPPFPPTAPLPIG